jgi:plasmid stabilization system protein ParE
MGLTKTTLRTMWELNLNRANADLVLEKLEHTDLQAAQLIETSLERLAEDPKSFEHEPIPGDAGYPNPKRFLMRSLDPDWLIAWAYVPGRQELVVGKIFHVSEIGAFVADQVP